MNVTPSSGPPNENAVPASPIQQAIEATVATFVTELADLFPDAAGCQQNSVKNVLNYASQRKWGHSFLPEAPLDLRLYASGDRLLGFKPNAVERLGLLAHTRSVHLRESRLKLWGGSDTEEHSSEPILKGLPVPLPHRFANALRWARGLDPADFAAISIFYANQEYCLDEFGICFLGFLRALGKDIVSFPHGAGYLQRYKMSWSERLERTLATHFVDYTAGGVIPRAGRNRYRALLNFGRRRTGGGRPASWLVLTHESSVDPMPAQEAVDRFVRMAEEVRVAVDGLPDRRLRILDHPRSIWKLADKGQERPKDVFALRNQLDIILCTAFQTAIFELIPAGAFFIIYDSSDLGWYSQEWRDFLLGLAGTGFARNPEELRSCLQAGDAERKQVVSAYDRLINTGYFYALRMFSRRMVRRFPSQR